MKTVFFMIAMLFAIQVNAIDCCRWITNLVPSNPEGTCDDKCDYTWVTYWYCCEEADEEYQLQGKNPNIGNTFEFYVDGRIVSYDEMIQFVSKNQINLNEEVKGIFDAYQNNH